MITLAWDTETTGFALDDRPPDHPSQPHLVQLGLALYDEQQHERAYASLIVKPDGWVVPEGAAKVHGITTELATAVGLPLLVVLSVFNQLSKVADRHVGHNVQFDVKIITTAYTRAGKVMPALDLRCTQEMSDAVMKLPPTDRMVKAGYGHKSKPPRLAEAIEYLFNESLPGAHDALVDARASARVFFELERRAKDVQQLPESS